MPLEKWATQLNYAEPRVENDFVNGDTSRSAVVRTVAAMPLSYIGWEAAFWTSVAAVGLAVAEAEALAASGAVPEPVFTSGRVVSTLTGSEDPKSASVPVPVAVGGGPVPVSYEEYLDYRRAIALR